MAAGGTQSVLKPSDFHLMPGSNMSAAQFNNYVSQMQTTGESTSMLQGEQTFVIGQHKRSESVTNQRPPEVAMITQNIIPQKTTTNQMYSKQQSMNSNTVKQ